MFIGGKRAIVDLVLSLQSTRLSLAMEFPRTFLRVVNGHEWTCIGGSFFARDTVNKEIWPCKLDGIHGEPKIMLDDMESAADYSYRKMRDR